MRWRPVSRSPRRWPLFSAHQQVWLKPYCWCLHSWVRGKSCIPTMTAEPQAQEHTSDLGSSVFLAFFRDSMLNFLVQRRRGAELELQLASAPLREENSTRRASPGGRSFPRGRRRYNATAFPVSMDCRAARLTARAMRPSVPVTWGGWWLVTASAKPLMQTEEPGGSERLKSMDSVRVG